MGTSTTRGFRFSTIAMLGGAPAAAAIARGVYWMHPDGSWRMLHEGLPGEALIYRLRVVRQTLFAATSKGLYMLSENKWLATEIDFPCYDVTDQDGYLMASSARGLLCDMIGKWISVAYPTTSAYQLLVTPEFLFLGFGQGIAMYDCWTGLWEEFPMRTGVSSLAVYRKRLVGATRCGRLIVGDMQGGFNHVRFAGIRIHSLVQRQSDVFVCTDRGLFMLQTLKERLLLRSVYPGCSATDLAFDDSGLWLSTLDRGVLNLPAGIGR